ncbi:MAG: RIP metalloprotease RseP [Steroidobacteraceae bacterium]
MSLSWQHLLAFLFAVGLLVTVHEFGHFWVARRLGFKVLRFSVGFGKALWSHTGSGPDRTEYVVAAIPLGGYVKLLDEREGAVDPAEAQRAFNRRPPWQRILVLLAGPAFNIIFAVLLLAGMLLANGVTEVRAVVGEVHADSPAARAGLAAGDEILQVGDRAASGQGDVMLGLLDRISDDGRAPLRVRDESGRERQLQLTVDDAAERRRLTEPELLLTGLGFAFWRPQLPASIGSIAPGGPAAKAGLAAGDEVLAVDGAAVHGFEDLRQRIESSPGRNLLLQVRRGGAELALRVDVASEQVDGRSVGRVGIGSTRAGSYPDSMLRHRQVGPWSALVLGTTQAWDMTALQARVFWRMLRGQVSLKNLSGPLTIAEYAGESASSGVSAFAGFLVLISLSLGFLNLLPIPVLDGGQIVYQALEWVKGSPLSERLQILGQQLGIALLVLLMGVALFNDIVRQFG